MSVTMHRTSYLLYTSKNDKMFRDVYLFFFKWQVWLLASKSHQYMNHYHLLFLETLIQARYKGCKRKDKDVGIPLSLLFFTVNRVQVCKQKSDLQTPLSLPDFPPLANALSLISTTNKTPLRNGNCPITDPIMKMRVAHTVGLRV